MSAAVTYIAVCCCSFVDALLFYCILSYSIQETSSNLFVGVTRLTSLEVVAGCKLSANCSLAVPGSLLLLPGILFVEHKEEAN